MKINADIQRLEPGALIELFELDATEQGGDVLRFHAHVQAGSIWWQGKEYVPWPVQANGFARTGDGQQPSPTLSVGNVDASISALCLYLQDMVGAKIMRRRTLGKYLDGRNFQPGPDDGPGMVLDFVGQPDERSGANAVLDFVRQQYQAAGPTFRVWDGNPDADPSEELPPELWFIEQKTDESNEAVTFELSGALDFSEVQLPRRQIVANVCVWLSIGGYRGVNCGYTGAACFDRNDNPVADPSLDRCAGRLSSCKRRFGESNPLPYGSFPAADLLRT